jgi:alpha-tubulin N-acetyltransferase 1
MGYDRPSSKLLSFLSKHFNLNMYTPQTNNFVVYNDYFKKEDKQSK